MIHLKSIIILASILVALDQEISASSLRLDDDLINQVGKTMEGKDKRRLWLVKSESNGKKIPKHMRIRVWTDPLGEPLKGRYHILSDSTIQIDSMILNTHDIQKLSTITIPSIIGYISIWGGMALLIVTPVQSSLSTLFGEYGRKPFEGTRGGLISAAVLLTAGEILSHPFTSKKMGKWRVMIMDK